MNLRHGRAKFIDLYFYILVYVPTFSDISIRDLIHSYLALVLVAADNRKL